MTFTTHFRKYWIRNKIQQKGVERDDISDVIVSPIKINILALLFEADKIGGMLFPEICAKMDHDIYTDHVSTILYLLELKNRDIVEKYTTKEKVDPVYKCVYYEEEKYKLTRYGKELYRVIGRVAVRAKEEGIFDRK